MVWILRVIVHAKDEEEAFRKGKEALDKIVERIDTAGGIHITFESKELLDEWEVEQNLPPVLLASSPQGMQLIEEGWQFTVEMFMGALERIKLAIQYLTPEQIMEEDPLGNLSEEIERKVSPIDIRDEFREVGGVGENFFKLLYFDDFLITSKHFLNWVLNPGEELTVFVIPAAIFV